VRRTARRAIFAWTFAYTCLGALAACGDDGSAALEGPAGVGQAGAQDFGHFRALLDAGKIPGPETLDAVGFFNEHKIELPDPKCGNDVCIHGMLGVMGNMITGSNCTMVLIGMNTPLDATEIERPPLRLAIAADVSGSMAGANITNLKTGLHMMLDALRPEDRVSLVAFSDEARVLAEAAAPDAPELRDAIDGLVASGDTNIYDGLRRAYELAEASGAPNAQNRVLLLSDGVATAGLQARERSIELARRYAAEGLGTSTIGLGSEFDIELMRGVAELGAGSFYFVEDPSALPEIFVDEATAFLVPIARQAKIEVEIGDGYALRAIYGTRLFDQFGNEATIDMPILQIAGRTSVEDVAGGRRGGGGAIVLELLPTDEDPRDVGSLAFAYTMPATNESVEQHVSIDSPLDVGETPAGGFFSAPQVEKAFVALNVYVGLSMASELASVGEDGQAIVTLQALRNSLFGWLADRATGPDADIEGDLDTIDRFLDLLAEREARTQPIRPPEPWPSD
jgi:Ca-activated chloride channel family protein